MLNKCSQDIQYVGIKAPSEVLLIQINYFQKTSTYKFLANDQENIFRANCLSRR